MLCSFRCSLQKLFLFYLGGCRSLEEMPAGKPPSKIYGTSVSRDEATQTNEASFCHPRSKKTLCHGSERLKDGQIATPNVGSAVCFNFCLEEKRTTCIVCPSVRPHRFLRPCLAAALACIACHIEFCSNFIAIPIHLQQQFNSSHGNSV